MKQLAQYQDGTLELQEVPLPTPPPGGIRVRLTHSVVSVGTERMKVEQARMNLLQKARARPDQVRKVLDTARNLGWRAALDKVRNRLESPSPLGYSAAGVVDAIDAGHTRFRVGDRVACGGAECAFHAEFIAVPDLLTARVPDTVHNAQAAYTTIAAIALQSVRQLAPALGDRVLVIGQGLVGLLVTNLLAANGCRVLAMDLAEARRPVATALGAERVVIPGQQDLTQELRAWTDGFGVDSVVLATAASSNTPTEQALQAVRDRGRLVVVGNTHVELPWKLAYEKELEVRYSRSYGPGRYDPAYEWGGMDYPIGYVRWTEQRNFEACLHLMASGALRLEALTTRRVPFHDCLEVYNRLASGSADLGVILEYPTDGPSKPATVEKSTVPTTHEPSAETLTGPPATLARAAGEGAPATSRAGEGSPPRFMGHQQVALEEGASHAPTTAVGEVRRATPVDRVDVIGAGNFARTMLLPHLKGRVALGTVVNQTALSANHVKTKFGFAAASTDAQAVLAAHPATDAAVLIATRHHLHAPLVLAAVGAGRDVFVEKPLCLTEAELEALDEAVQANRATVQVGFNRRFAPAGVALKRLLREAPGPKALSFRVMAGRLDPAHWYANLAESGGRVLGEACHFLDFFRFLLDQPAVRVSAQTAWPPFGRLPFPDSISAQVEFADGSSAQLIYTAEGDPTWPKEVCTVFAAGLVAEIDNFQVLTIHRSRRKQRLSFSGKGHAEQITAWTAYLRGEGVHPLPYTSSSQSMRLTFATLTAVGSGMSIDLRRPS